MSRKIELSKLEEIKKHFQSLPRLEKKKTEVSKSEAIAAMKKEIQQLQSKNYSLPQIAAILTDVGINITASTLKSYLKRQSAKPIRTEGAGRSAGENPSQ